MADKTLKDKVDDLTSELKSAKEQAEEDSGELISKIEVLREQAKVNTKDLLEGIGEASDTISESIRDVLEAEREALAELREEFKKEKNDKRAFEKSKQFFSQGTAEFRKSNFYKAMDYFQTAQREAMGISFLSFKENGLSMEFNSKFMIARCLEGLDRGMGAVDIYYQLYVNTTEDSDYHKLFAEKTLSPTLSVCAKGIWESWSEERKEKIRRAANLSIEPESGEIPYCFSPDWRVIYILSLFNPEFKAYYGLFEKVRLMHKERLVFLRKIKNKIDESKQKIRILSQQKEDLERSRKFEENAQPSFRPKDFSGAGIGWLVGFLTVWLGTSVLVAIMIPVVGIAIFFPMIICVPVGIATASISKNKKFKRAFEEFKKQKQLKISERMKLISQVEPEIDDWREHKSQLEKWHDDNHILIVEFEK